MKKLTDNLIDAEHDRLWSEAIKKHGSEFAVPKDESFRIGEILRGMFVVQLWQKENPDGKNPLGFLNTYSVSEEASRHIISLLGISNTVQKQTVKEAAKKPETRKDKWATFEKWARGNAGKQFTTEELVDKSGFSYQTTLKYISESPTFLKVKKGIWTISSDSR